MLYAKGLLHFSELSLNIRDSQLIFFIGLLQLAIDLHLPHVMWFDKLKWHQRSIDDRNTIVLKDEAS